MRTGFEHRVGATLMHDLGKKPLQIERFGRRRGGRPDFRGRTIFDGAEKAGAPPGRAHDRIDQEARGGLAVGSSNPNYFQFVRGPSEEIRAYGSQRLARIGNA